jgi:hypothetical protein
LPCIGRQATQHTTIMQCSAMQCNASVGR